ncbi:hypothetical protein [Methylogaea oryzae]|uniref:hypothetical protein n=1 Tax=Methylogaea oryzae TaxID=1295382 RepID=UPI0020D03182|nr:hypothetical protein [Methylogaea oryzae]
MTLGVRLGRVKLPIGLYNATRDVPFTKPTILLPQSIYFERTRDLALSADGGMFYGEHRADWGNISADFGVFSLGVDSAESNLAVFGRNRVTGQSWPGSLQSKPSYISRLMYEHTDEDGGNLRLGITSIWLNAYFDPKLPAAQRLVGRTRYDLEKGDFTFQPWYFSAQYTAENWSLTGEYAFRQLHFQGFGSPMDRRVDGESWYLQGTYRLAPQWQAVARYDVYYANRDDRGGNAWRRPSDLYAVRQRLDRRLALRHHPQTHAANRVPPGQRHRMAAAPGQPGPQEDPEQLGYLRGAAFLPVLAYKNGHGQIDAIGEIPQPEMERLAAHQLGVDRRNRRLCLLQLLRAA